MRLYWRKEMVKTKVSCRYSNCKYIQVFASKFGLWHSLNYASLLQRRNVCMLNNYPYKNSLMRVQYIIYFLEIVTHIFRHLVGTYNVRKYISIRINLQSDCCACRSQNYLHFAFIVIIVGTVENGKTFV